MKLPFLASFIIFIIVLTHRLHYDRRQEAKSTQSFWLREREANRVRRKSLDGLDYIKIPLSDFPTDVLSQDEIVADCIREVRELAELPIVNLTGYSNTDLKLEYGAPNIDKLSDYDQNYTVLVRTLQRWADALWQAGHRAEACVLMEFAVSTGTDVKETYYKLAEYRNAEGETDRIRPLIETASSLRSVNRDIIIRRLKELYPV